MRKMLLLIFLGVYCFAYDIENINGEMETIKADTVEIPSGPTYVVIQGVPAYYWSYGCFPTSAAMMLGYWDNNGFPDIYTGPTNNGDMPISTAGYWPPGINGSDGACPLSASHCGIDNNENRGHVDDYWYWAGSDLPDPYVTNGWTEHQPDCLADFCGSNQNSWNTIDEATKVALDYSPLYDYTGLESDGIRDGCHGIRLFLQSRGYDALVNYSQYKYGYNGIDQGFTWQDFTEEISNGYPVLIHLKSFNYNHTVLAFGYTSSTSGNTIYLHDTFDEADHEMQWDGYYGRYGYWYIYAVTVIHLTVDPPVPQNFTGLWVNNHPKIIWDAVPVSDLDHYEVWKKVDGVWSLKTTTTDTYYVDNGETKYSLGNIKTYVYYKVKAVDTSSNYSGFTPQKSFAVNDEQIASSKGEYISLFHINPLPTEFCLHSAYPNPFNPTTNLQLDLPEPTTFSLAIYDLNGKEVWRLNNSQTNSYNAGYHTITWDATNKYGSQVPTGVYFMIFNSKDQHLTQKVILLK